MSLSPEEAGCPIRDDSWPRWLKVRDGSVIWFDAVTSWDGQWIRVEHCDDTMGTTVGDWIDCPAPLRPTSIRWSEVVAHGEVQG
tara:strand:+ start:487 stop:738 length:252 start_codon:yes stop_codon:yes gene_type:complete